MPEMRFKIWWPDGIAELCYSPSSVIKDFFVVGETYPLEDFIERSRIALRIASDRVQAKYGAPCSRALGQIARIETTGAKFAATPNARVSIGAFED
jgi:uncharacterized repeat protein (TIGR04042 family)